MPSGRISIYDEEIHPQRAYDLCSFGATDKDLAERFEVTEQTINNWKHAHPTFFESIKKGKDIFDTKKVEEALFLRATGYEHDEDKIFMFEGQEIIVPTRKHYPPDATSMIFWLKNRQPQRWRDRREIEAKVTTTEPIPLADLEAQIQDEESREE